MSKVLKGSQKRNPLLILKHIVMGDVTGYGAMSDAEVFNFSKTIVPQLLALSSKHHCPRLEIIGDAILGIFDNFIDAAKFALDVRDYFRAKAWADARRTPNPVHISGDPRMRIALHSGEIFVQEQQGAKIPHTYGSEISRTARIEPVVQPNEVFISAEANVEFDKVKAKAKANKSSHISFGVQRVGICRLPKEHRRQELYRLGRDSDVQAEIKPRITELLYLEDWSALREFVVNEVKLRKGSIKHVRWLGFNGGATVLPLWELVEPGLANRFNFEICVWDHRCSRIPHNLSKDKTEVNKTRFKLKEEIERLHRYLKSNDQYGPISGGHIAELCCEYLMLASLVLRNPNRHLPDTDVNVPNGIEGNTTDAVNRLNGRVTLKKSPLYIPGRVIFIDDLVFASFYLHDKHGGPIIMAAQHSDLYKKMDVHFKAAWKHATETIREISRNKT